MKHLSNPTFGIIGAMAQEIELLKKVMTDVQEHLFGTILVYSGKLDGQSVALCLSGIGKVNAAIATTILVEHFSVDYVVNTGSAGGLGADVGIGDVVIGTQMAHHDVDVSAFGYAYGQIPKLPQRFDAYNILIFSAEFAAQQIGMRVHHGLVVSGDQFISDHEARERIYQHFPDVLAVEMEAAAIAQTCQALGKPFVVIRSISDTADNGAEISFEAFLQLAATHSAQIVRGLIVAMVSPESLHFPNHQHHVA